MFKTAQRHNGEKLLLSALTGTPCDTSHISQANTLSHQNPKSCKTNADKLFRKKQDTEQQ